MLNQWLAETEAAYGAAELARWLWGVTLLGLRWGQGVESTGGMDGYMNVGQEHMVRIFWKLPGLPESARANSVVP